MSETPTLRTLLVEHQDDLARFVARHAGARLLRFESAEDLVQGMLVQILAYEESFEYRSVPEFLAWLYRIARQQIYKRTAHWYAAKRGSGDVVRLLARETGEIDPPASGTSPSSFAGRREQVVLVTRALARLGGRDREIVEWSAAGASIEELAERLGIAYEAAKKARLRALERLRKLYELAAK